VAAARSTQYTEAVASAVASYDKPLAIHPNKIVALTDRGAALINLEQFTTHIIFSGQTGKLVRYCFIYL
jgi:hypothetical protein